MAKKHFKNPNQIMNMRTKGWFEHYYQYLTSLAYQLFEWEGLPDSIDPQYLEMSIHLYGYVGFYKHKSLGYLAVQGALSGTQNHYLKATKFHVNVPNLQDTFTIYNYSDMKDIAKKMGVVIYNNDYHFSTVPSLNMFAQDLAELKSVIYVNQNAQKTPVLITANDMNRLSIQNIYDQYAGNSPVIMTHESVNQDTIKVFKTDAPYVVDKLNTQKNAVWNEVMTYLGIKNANLEKRERMITSEVDSNDEQITASGNVYLKARQEACDRINELYPDLKVSVKFRTSILEEFQKNIDETNTIQKGGASNE